MPHHAHSIDRWDDATGSNLYEHLAGEHDLLPAVATFAVPSIVGPAPSSPYATGRASSKRRPADD